MFCGGEGDLDLKLGNMEKMNLEVTKCAERALKVNWQRIKQCRMRVKCSNTRGHSSTSQARKMLSLSNGQTKRTLKQLLMLKRENSSLTLVSLSLSLFASVDLSSSLFKALVCEVKH